MYLGPPGRSSVGSFYEIWKDGRKSPTAPRRSSGWIERPLDAVAGSARSTLARDSADPPAR